MTTVRGATRRGASQVFAAGWVLVLAAASVPALAAQQRSFVSSTGSDMALCTLASPCRSFVNAIAATNPGGEVIVLDSAGYGPVNIIKSISIIAPAGVYAGISVASGDGVLIDAPGETVVLRGLAINGLGGTYGIRVHAADRVRIESCTISNINQDGIHHEAAGAEVVVLDTIVRDNGNFGINLIAGASILLDHVRSEHNDTSGLHVGPVSGTATAAVAESVFTANGVNGIVASAASGQATYMHVDRSLITNNGSAGVLATSASAGITISLAGNGISANGAEGVLLSGTGSGGVKGILSGNSITRNVRGLYATGDAVANVAANTMADNISDLACDGGALILSIGNNFAFIADYTPSTCHTTMTGE